MIDGLSIVPKISKNTVEIVKEKLQDIDECYRFLLSIDKNYMRNISKNDKYRIEKALELYIETNIIPSIYFEQNQPKPIIKNLPIYQIDTQTEILRHRIKLRTKKMLQNGIIDEVINLEKKYTREPNCMGAIGIVETLDYLDGKIDKQKLEELISIHTAQLAKRQRTFNRSQFSNITIDSLENLESLIINNFKSCNNLNDR
jgi:tRNA dimethylallyltransferase